MSKYLLFFILATLIVSCNTVKSPLFGKRSAHEQYSDALKKSGLDASTLGKMWLSAAKTALDDPQKMSLPYRETGFFSAVNPIAAGWVFKVQRGQKLRATLTRNPDSVILFLELWRAGGNPKSMLAAIDTTDNTLSYTITKEDSLILRLQPELLADVEYTVDLTIEPSLAFPVEKSGKPQMISFWGMDRDNGARSHEGVDIAAAFRTPVLAAADGIVSRVNENRLGGKVVFLRDENTGDNLYYAHLDSQIAVQGQRVRVGDTLGLVGNTGNARNTVPHLHFGIYSFGGAVNPLPFIDPEIKKPSKVTASLEQLNRFLRTLKSTTLLSEPASTSQKIQAIAKDEPVFILAATGNHYKVRLVNGKTGFVSSNSLTQKKMKELMVRESGKLFLQPAADSPVKGTIAPGGKVDVLGIYEDFYYVDNDGFKGWIVRPA